MGGDGLVAFVFYKFLSFGCVFCFGGEDVVVVVVVGIRRDKNMAYSCT